MAQNIQAELLTHSGDLSFAKVSSGVGWTNLILSFSGILLFKGVNCNNDYYVLLLSH